MQPFPGTTFLPILPEKTRWAKSMAKSAKIQASRAASKKTGAKAQADKSSKSAGNAKSKSVARNKTAKTTPPNSTPVDFNVVVVGQAGRISYEALLFVASLRASDPDFSGRVFVAEPQPGEKWPDDPRIRTSVSEALQALGAEILPFQSHHFGADYPNGNKIEALLELPEGEPFVFFDSDTVVTGKLSEVAFDFSRPSASMKRENTWPNIELYGPGYGEIWGSLYRKFALDFDGSLDLSQPDEYWERYMYFNAGWFYGRCPREFGARFLEYALAIRDKAPEELVCQELYPWLDQITLPLVISSFEGGRPRPELDGLDGDVTCHWRILPLAYAREPDQVIEMIESVSAPNKIKKVLKEYQPMLRMIYQGRGQKVRALFDRDNLPRREQMIRNKIKREGFWMR
ncbi:hypothetical protein O2N63_10685 [Aliiroseovarius sp. KMU-50]|uniref:Glycosyl transferase n=1 Tax=Aliiroseovarius salicola TaxID=3009082 RepID=A0ABT4W223_9RHOB|nr:hypothetical protein [Aliiroseovarius sp. KMU-50]MDA5094550.1 hypothetical protein [Aliiroseovarius sp. KMU-50]